jgi:predicted acylesterase/phospholipase RssA
MTIDSLHVDRVFQGGLTTVLGASRMSALSGARWLLAARALEVIHALSLFGALGGFLSLIEFVANSVSRKVVHRRHSHLQLRRGLLIAIAVSLLSLQGCTQVVKSDSTSPNHGGVPNMIRTLGADQTFSNLSTHTVAQRVRALHGGEVLNILALSAGGADGAFGAGALVGLTRSGSRPQFAIVTGVSAGALIAPYAFLGPAWDSQLVEIYTTGRAEHLLQPRGLGALFGSSIYRGTPLKELVDRYTPDALIQAVAREAAAGRLLLIVTTDVETGEPVVWDLGSIAMNGGPHARTLFRDVLVASASVPGMLPPVIIRVQEQSTMTEEAHVDGMVSVPFFVPAGFAEMPEDDVVGRSRGAIVYVIIDGRLSEEPRSLPLRARAILSRSVSAGLNHMMRTTLELTAANVELQGAQLQYAAIPLSFPTATPFDFRAQTTRPLFGYGYACALAGRLWISSRRTGGYASSDSVAASQHIPCPADDENEFVAGVASTVEASQ